MYSVNSVIAEKWSDIKNLGRDASLKRAKHFEHKLREKVQI